MNFKNQNLEYLIYPLKIREFVRSIEDHTSPLNDFTKQGNDCLSLIEPYFSEETKAVIQLNDCLEGGLFKGASVSDTLISKDTLINDHNFTEEALEFLEEEDYIEIQMDAFDEFLENVKESGGILNCFRPESWATQSLENFGISLENAIEDARKRLEPGEKVEEDANVQYLYRIQNILLNISTFKFIGEFEEEVLDLGRTPKANSRPGHRRK